MVGYMHLNAEGIPEDNAEALAWFRLAAERGEPLLSRVRDELLSKMTPEEVSASDAIFLDLWKSMGDRALLMELIRRDMRTLRAQTGTRIPGAASSSSAVIYKPSGEVAGPNFYRDIRNRLTVRIQYLDTRVEISDDVLADELREIRSQEEAVKQELSAMENR